MTINVELQIAGRPEPWHRITLVAVPRVGDYIALNIVEGREKVGRKVRVERVLFVADKHQSDSQDVVVLQATLLTSEDANGLGFR